MHFGRAELYFPQGEDGTEGDDNYNKIDNIRSQHKRPKKGLEPQFYTTAQASAALAIDVSPNARIGINVGPSILGKGNLVDAQIIAFVNGTLEFSADVSASAGTGTDPTFTYRYGAYLYYNLGYGGFANILAGTWNWHYEPVYLYSLPGMRYTIYENDNVESDEAPGSKRSLETDPSLDDDFHGALIGTDDDTGSASIQPYFPPTHQLRHRRQGHRRQVTHSGYSVQNSPNSTMAEDAGMIIFKRTDPDTPMPDADSSATFWERHVFNCPERKSTDIRLPELRYKPSDRSCPRESYTNFSR